MKVRVMFTHPISGLRDVTIEQAASIDEVKEKLLKADCKIISIEEEL